jgi:hypothetical protein
MAVTWELVRARRHCQLQRTCLRPGTENGPRSFAWFLTVVADYFDKRRRRAEVARAGGREFWSGDGIEPVNSDQDSAGSQSRGLERIVRTGALFCAYVVHLLALPSNRDPMGTGAEGGFGERFCSGTGSGSGSSTGGSTNSVPKGAPWPYSDRAGGDSPGLDCIGEGEVMV